MGYLAQGRCNVVSKFLALWILIVTIVLPVGQIQSTSAPVNVGQSEKRSEVVDLLANAWTSETISSMDIRPHATAIDAAGNLYVAAATRVQSRVIRMLMKYTPDGQEVIGSNGHWFTQSLSVSGNLHANIAAQEMVIDRSRNTGYVLLTAALPNNTYSAFLIKHNLTTNQVSWNSMVHIGGTLNPRSRLAIDGNGNLWIARPDNFVINGIGNAGFWLECVRPTDGRKINSGYNVASAGHIISLSALAGGGSRLYVAYTDFDRNAQIQKDLAVKVLNVQANGQFSEIASLDRTDAIPEPADMEGSHHVPPSNAKHHPIYTHGVIDKDGNFQIAGYYSFVRADCAMFAPASQGNCPPSGDQTRRYYPVLAKITANGSDISLYIESGSTADAWVDSKPNNSTATARVSVSAEGHSFVIIQADSSRIWEISADKRVATSVFYPIMFEYPNGSGCLWYRRWHVNYVTEPLRDVISSRIIATGIVRLSRTEYRHRQCLDTPSPPQPQPRLRIASFSIHPQWPALFTKLVRFRQRVTFQGNDGPWTYLSGASATIWLDKTRNASLQLPFWFMPSGPSNMSLDIRVLVDGVERAMSRSVAPGNGRMNEKLGSLNGGFHEINIQVRSRLLGGPPSSFYVMANQNSTGPVPLEISVQ